MTIGQTFPPAGSLRSMTWKRTGGVYPRCPTFTRDHRCIRLWTPTGRTRTSPCSPRSPPARTQALTRRLRVCSRHSRDARTSTCLLPDAPAPPPPGPMQAPWISWAGGYGYGVAVVLCCGGWGAGGHVRARARWGGCPGAVAGCLFTVGVSWVVYYVRSPHHRQPFRKCPRCFPTTSSSKRHYVTD